MPMQLRLATELTGEQYVNRQAWQEATLERCPLHPQGGCSFARHGTYERVNPPGTRIARWYCPEGHCTFSLLPDCLACRLSGTLVEVEAVVAEAEQAPSQERAADRLRPDGVELPSALRWLRRRVKAVHAALVIVLGLLPEMFLGCSPTVSDFRQCLQTPVCLVQLRALAAAFLGQLPAPLGFGPRYLSRGERQRADQQSLGPDPPG